MSYKQKTNSPFFSIKISQWGHLGIGPLIIVYPHLSLVFFWAWKLIFTRKQKKNNDVSMNLGFKIH